MKKTIRWLAEPLLGRMRTWVDFRIQKRIDAHHAGAIEQLRLEVRQLQHASLFIPPCPPLWESTAPFMAYSTCSTADFVHPRYAEICAQLSHPAIYHRKAWEWVYVIHHLEQAGVLQPGKRGLAFGVGTERLPALFAKLGAEVVATDAPVSIGEGSGWHEFGQHSTVTAQLRYPEIVDGAVFDAKVTHRACDMNNIPDDLRDFDFNWSCCCFEHLGSIEAGLQFVVNAVEKTLKVGGVACHTTEFNLSSDDATVSEGDTVLFRRRDMEELARRLRERGHQVQPFAVAPDSHYLDGYVDVPPYTENPHIKLLLRGYVATSVGIVVVRGR